MGLLSAVVQGATSLLGAKMASDANSRAAEAATDANVRAAEIAAQQSERAREEFQQAAQRGIQAIRAGGSEFQTRLGQIPTRPIYGPAETTPGQQQILDDSRRQAQAMLAAGGLRGAGRAVSAAVDDVEGRLRSRFYDQNQADADRELNRRQRLAESGAEQAAGMGRDIANTEIGAGTRVGNTYLDQGRAEANLAQQSGAVQANAATASGNVWGQTVGNIGAIVADELVQRRTRDVAGSNVRRSV